MQFQIVFAKLHIYATRTQACTFSNKRNVDLQIRFDNAVIEHLESLQSLGMNLSYSQHVTSIS